MLLLFGLLLRPQLCSIGSIFLLLLVTPIQGVTSTNNSTCNEDFLKQVDFNNNGSLDFSEFLLLLNTMAGPQCDLLLNIVPTRRSETTPVTHESLQSIWDMATCICLPYYYYKKNDADDVSGDCCKTKDPVIPLPDNNNDSVYQEPQKYSEKLCEHLETGVAKECAKIILQQGEHYDVEKKPNTALSVMSSTTSTTTTLGNNNNSTSVNAKNNNDTTNNNNIFKKNNSTSAKQNNTRDVIIINNESNNTGNSSSDQKIIIDDPNYYIQRRLRKPETIVTIFIFFVFITVFTITFFIENKHNNKEDFDTKRRFSFRRTSSQKEKRTLNLYLKETRFGKQRSLPKQRSLTRQYEP